MENKAARSHYLRAWPLLVFSVLCYFITSTVGSAMNIAAVLLEQTRGWDSVLITSMISVASVGNVVAGFIAGRACSKASAKKLCVRGASSTWSASPSWVSPRSSRSFRSPWSLPTPRPRPLATTPFPCCSPTGSPPRRARSRASCRWASPWVPALPPSSTTWASTRLASTARSFPSWPSPALPSRCSPWASRTLPRSAAMPPDTLERCEPHKVERTVEQQGASAKLARDLLRNPRFVLLSLVLGIQLIFSGGLMVQLAPRLLELGYTMDEAMGPCSPPRSSPAPARSSVASLATGSAPALAPSSRSSRASSRSSSTSRATPPASSLASRSSASSLEVPTTGPSTSAPSTLAATDLPAPLA